ncbi:hypothetical protein FDP41_002828 [Naegleria fowleri]|uniref:GTP-binding nuclear protein n=1 Tax=Naegleria fowleri TaxID=5763 RepID=A0A6A5BK15_NAEFO|nr:uncharacterized protein FDP41_002828 [Naegleria fowleri]KAF0978313.1 hypothetical protein FDP41_002828 [Naegleria fowleri]
MRPIASFDVVLVRDDSTGKSSFMDRFLIDPQNVCPRSTFNTFTLFFKTTKGEIHLRIFDSFRKFGRLRDTFYIRKHAAIIMFDVTHRNSFKNVRYWIKDIMKNCGEHIPMVLCGNKVDLLKERKVKSYHVNMDQGLLGMKYFEVSALANFNIDQPMVYLMRKLLKDDALDLVETVPMLQMVPPLVVLDTVEYFLILEKEWWIQKSIELFQVYEEDMIFFDKMERTIFYSYFSDIDIVSFRAF